MPRMSREYCKKTPIRKMGFSQKASCKAQGLIARTSRKSKGQFVKSQSQSPKRNRTSLFSNSKSKKKKPYFTGYGTEEKAKKMLKSIKRLPSGKQK